MDEIPILQGNTKKQRYESLVAALYQDVYRYAFWLCKNQPMAEDLVQETFLRAWRSLESLQNDKAVKACEVMPAFQSAHLIFEGTQGAVSVIVIVINNRPVSIEYSFHDERFNGIVVPMGEGNMVLVGENNEDLEQYKTLFADNIDWVI